MKMKANTELLTFAEQFAKSYKILSGGDYFSDNKEHHIRYLDGKKGSANGMPHGTKTFARVSKTDGRIDLDKIALTKHKEITENFVFYLILWCVERLKVQSETEADIEALRIYLAMSRPPEDVKIGWLKQFEITAKDSLDSLNKKRYEAIDKFISGKK